MSGALNSVMGGGNILGAALNVVGMVYPPAKIAASVFNLALGAASGGLKGALSGLMQNFGMPKFVADMVGGAADKVVKNLTKMTEAAVDQLVKDRLGSRFDKIADEIAKQVMENTLANLKKDGKDVSKGDKASAKSWLMAIAEAMGKVMGEKAKEMVELSHEMQENTESAGDDKESKADAAQKNTALNAKFQAASQEFNMMSSAFSTAIKALGEGTAQMARKQ